MNNFFITRNKNIVLFVALGVTVLVILVINHFSLQDKNDSLEVVDFGDAKEEFYETEVVNVAGGGKKAGIEMDEGKTEEAQIPIEEADTDKPTKTFTIQVSSFRDQIRANEVLSSLQKLGYSPYIVSKDLGERGVWYRVRVGSFNKKEEAMTALNNLKKKYKDSFILSRE